MTESPAWMIILVIVLFLSTYYYFQNQRQCQHQKLVVDEMLLQTATVNRRMREASQRKQLRKQRELIHRSRTQVQARKNIVHHQSLKTLILD